MATAESFRQAIEMPAAVASEGQQQAPSSHQPIVELTKTHKKRP
jgi:hypothetical protein